MVIDKDNVEKLKFPSAPLTLGNMIVSMNGPYTKRLMKPRLLFILSLIQHLV